MHCKSKIRGDNSTRYNFIYLQRGDSSTRYQSTKLAHSLMPEACKIAVWRVKSWSSNVCRACQIKTEILKFVISVLHYCRTPFDTLNLSDFNVM